MSDAMNPTDTLTDQEVEELDDRDDNLDNADVDASQHRVRKTMMICGITAGVLALAAGIAIAVIKCKHSKLYRMHKQFDNFTSSMKTLYAEHQPSQIVQNKEVQQAMNVISEHIHDLPSQVQNAAEQVRNTLTR